MAGFLIHALSSLGLPKADVHLLAQAAYLDSIMDTKLAWKPAQQVIQGCWEDRTDLYPIYVDVVQNTGTPLSCCSTLKRIWLVC